MSLPNRISVLARPAFYNCPLFVSIAFLSFEILARDVRETKRRIASFIACCDFASFSCDEEGEKEERKREERKRKKERKKKRKRKKERKRKERRENDNDDISTTQRNGKEREGVRGRKKSLVTTSQPRYQETTKRGDSKQKSVLLDYRQIFAFSE